MSDRGFTYLIVGGGMTADAAVRGIRELDADGTIGVIGSDPDPPYARPPLSKALWKGDPLESVWKKTADVGPGIELMLGRRVVSIDRAAKRVRDDQGADFAYDKLLIATGGTPRRLPFLDDAIYFRTLRDYRRLRERSDAGKSFAVIGGGFIGAEIAAALAMQGRRVTMLFPDAGLGARVFPADLASNLVAYYQEKGVDVRAGENVIGASRKGDRTVLELKSGGRVEADAVVAGIGITTDTALASAAGLKVEDGIVVDDRLRTSVASIFAAGDVARFFAPALGRAIRVEHEDNANTMGRAAGRSMAGDETRYTHLPFFYSDLFDLGYEAVGDTDARAEMVADWKTPFREGVVYYLDGTRVKGVLLWNTWGQVDAARELIASKGPYTAKNLIGKLPAA